MIHTDIEKFVNLIIQSDSSFKELDRVYLTNVIFRLIGDGKGSPTKDTSTLKLANDLIDLAVKNNKIKDTVAEREILRSRLMDLLTPLPSKVNNIFWNKYQQSSKSAINYFYKLCCKNNYIKTHQIAKNISYITKTKFGNLEITINVSKPEITKKAALTATKDTSNYPLNKLAIENEGYLGRSDYPARSNHRVIRIMVNGKPWGLQFSPYSYFKEHTIFLSQKHVPMKICYQTFINLFDIVKQFPYYFVGSNSDLASVGGSLLSQNHYQGGPHIFPLMRAKINRFINFGIKGIKIGIVKWPISTIRLISKDPNLISNIANEILNYWKIYSDRRVNIIANIKGKCHHTITPIAYKINSDYILDIALRDDHSTNNYPEGVFNTHKDLKHIKADSIGLMEVMGRAILPSRLKSEMQEVEKYLLGKNNNIAEYHKAWANKLKRNNNIDKKNVKHIIRKGLGDSFAKILEDSGVYKWNSKGKKAFDNFLNYVKNKIRINS